MPVTTVIGPKARPDGSSIPISGAVQAGDMLYLSGQLAMNTEGQIEGDDIEAQTARTLQNIDATLAQCGRTKADIAKATVWLTDTGNFAGFNKAYAAYFGDVAPPARSTVCSGLMAPKALIEIEVVVYSG